VPRDLCLRRRRPVHYSTRAAVRGSALEQSLVFPPPHFLSHDLSSFTPPTGGHAAQESLHRGEHQGGIDLGEGVQRDIDAGLHSPDPEERRRAGGKKGGKVTQARLHGQDPSVIQGIHKREEEEKKKE
jgi:hypothetical protein